MLIKVRNLRISYFVKMMVGNISLVEKKVSLLSGTAFDLPNHFTP